MLIVRSLAFSASLAMGLSAHAQTPLPTVTKINDFFAPGATEVDAGAQPRLMALGTPASKLVLGQALKVRIFALGSHRDRPERSGTRGNCDLFVSATYPVRGDGNSLELMPTDYQWLAASTVENTISSGRYLLVLESAADSKDDFLLLDRKHQDDYFGSGMVLVVKPTGHPAKEQIMEAFKARRRSLESVELEVAQKIGGMTCYGFKKLTAGADGGYLEQVATCAAIKTPNDG